MSTPSIEKLNTCALGPALPAYQQSQRPCSHVQCQSSESVMHVIAITENSAILHRGGVMLDACFHKDFDPCRERITIR